MNTAAAGYAAPLVELDALELDAPVVELGPADTGTQHNTARPLVTKGNGRAVHNGMTGHMGLLVTACDQWGAHGVRGSRVRLAVADAATCKSCLKLAVQF